VFLLASILLASILLTLAAAPGRALADPAIRVGLLRSVVLDLGKRITTLAIADSSLADVLVVADRELLVQGKRVGTTSLVVWDASGGRTAYELSVIRGFVADQILLEVKVAEATTSALRELGVDFLLRKVGTNQERAVAVYGGAVSTPSIPLSIGEQATAVVRYAKAGEDLEALVHALEESGKVRLLANPNLACTSGETATFLSGGEIPIPVAQPTASGSVAVTIVWREFGVKLAFKPTVLDSDLVRIEVAPEVSNLDYTNAISFSGFVIPALRTRKAATTVELRHGQSVILGGLRSEADTQIESAVPVLGNLPLLGALFRRTSHRREDTELMILVSPRVVRPYGPGESPPALFDRVPERTP
jgi:pilus assembly protein CpaC